MADRSIAAGDTLNKLRFEFNGTAEDIGEISGITGASGIIASATDTVEAIVLLNTDLTTYQLTIMFLVVGLSYLKVIQTIVLKQLLQLLTLQQIEQYHYQTQLVELFYQIL